MVQVTFQLIPNRRAFVELPASCPVGHVLTAVRDAYGASLGEGSPHVIFRGSVLDPLQPHTIVQLKEGDTLLVAPPRKAPPARMRAAVGGEEDEGEEEKAVLPPSAGRWEHKVVAALKAKRLPGWMLEGVIVIRPLRITLFIAFLMGCVLSSYYSLGPVFILTAIIATIFANLGTRGEGQLSAYSIFNPGVRRLPGQLDADEVDRQMRQGQM